MAPQAAGVKPQRQALALALQQMQAGGRIVLGSEDDRAVRTAVHPMVRSSLCLLLPARFPGPSGPQRRSPSRCPCCLPGPG